MDAKLFGKSKKEIFFSSYVCHPSMANNEISGPVLLNSIMKYIKSKYPKGDLATDLFYYLKQSVR